MTFGLCIISVTLSHVVHELKTQEAVIISFKQDVKKSVISINSGT